MDYITTATDSTGAAINAISAITNYTFLVISPVNYVTEHARHCAVHGQTESRDDCDETPIVTANL